MSVSRLRLSHLATMALSASVLAACSTPGMSPAPEPAAPPPAVTLPSSIRADEVIGRWGYAAYHKEADRARTETAARGQCKQPYVIGRGPGGGVMMLTHDSPQQQELVLKGGPGGKNFIGLPGASGQPDDREVLTFDGRVMVLKWVDPEVAGRYGTGVFVRCGPRA